MLGADYAAVRVEGQILLHPYDPQQQVPAGREDKRFPEKQGEKVTHMVSLKTLKPSSIIKNVSFTFAPSSLVALQAMI